MFALCAYVLIFIFVIIHLIFKFIAKIELGTPPIGSLVIAYKYSYGGFFSGFSSFKRDVFPSSTYRTIRLYYTDNQAQNIEWACGVVLSESEGFAADNLLDLAERNGFSIIKTPSIPHAVYVIFPIIVCVTITKIFAIFVGYSKIQRFLEDKNLCGYPVLEIYSKDSITLIVPLMRQDEFVVNEAKTIVFGRMSKALENWYNELKDVGLRYGFNVGDFRDSKYSKSIKGNKSIKRETKG